MTQSVSVLTEAFIRGIAQIISFGLLLLGTSIAFWILQFIFQGVSQIPVIGGINRLLGFALGLLLGISLCWIVIWILTGLNTFTGGAANLPTFEESTLVKLGTPWLMDLMVLK